MKVWKIAPTSPPDGSLIMWDPDAERIPPWEIDKVPLPAGKLPLRIKPCESLEHPDDLGDFIYGPMHGGITVRAAFRDLVEEMDPGAGHYTPMVLILPDGTEIADTFWRFTSLHPIDAMIPEKLTVRQDTIRKGDFYTYTSGRHITFQGDAIGNRHIWRESQIGGSELYASDAFVKEMKRRGMEPFDRSVMPVE